MPEQSTSTVLSLETLKSAQSGQLDILRKLLGFGGFEGGEEVRSWVERGLGERTTPGFYL